MPWPLHSVQRWISLGSLAPVPRHLLHSTWRRFATLVRVRSDRSRLSRQQSHEKEDTPNREKKQQFVTVRYLELLAEVEVLEGHEERQLEVGALLHVLGATAAATSEAKEVERAAASRLLALLESLLTELIIDAALLIVGENLIGCTGEISRERDILMDHQSNDASPSGVMEHNGTGQLVIGVTTYRC